MKTILCYFLLSSSLISLWAQNGFAFLTFGELKLYSFHTKKLVDVSQNFNIYDYEISGNRVFILTTLLPRRSHYLRSQPPLTALYYTFFDFTQNDSAINYQKVDILDVSSITLSPDKGKLLVTILNGESDAQSNYHYEIIEIERNSRTAIKELDNCNVLGWFSNDDLLLQKNNNLFLFSLTQKRIFELTNCLNLTQNQIINFKTIDALSAVFQLKEELTKKIKLFIVTKTVAKEIYSLKSHRLDYVLSNNNEVILVVPKMNKRSMYYEMVKIDLTGEIIDTVNLFDLLNITAPFQKIFISENVKNDVLILFTTNPDGQSAFYKIDLRKMDMPELLFRKPSYSVVEMMRLY